MPTLEAGRADRVEQLQQENNKLEERLRELVSQVEALQKELMKLTGLTPAACAVCGIETLHWHRHDTAHGLAETHMAGSERYVCSVCGETIYKHQAAGRNALLPFVLD